MTQTQKFTVEMDESYPENTQIQQYHPVQFYPERGTVEAGTFQQASWSMDAHNHKCYTIACIPVGCADTSSLRDWLESDSVQASLAVIAEGYESRWDGNNMVGRLTEEARNELECLQLDSERFEQNMPRFWEADDWFGNALTSGEHLELFGADRSALTSDEPAEIHAAIQTLQNADIDEIVEREVDKATPDAHLEPSDVESYLNMWRSRLLNSLTERLAELAEEA